jgi:RNA 3'-terminal phosphate cyclase (ATP)
LLSGQIWLACPQRASSAHRNHVDHKDSIGPGNAVHLILPFANITEVITSFGARNQSAKHVANQAAKEAKHFLRATAPVGHHLADQLLLPMALLAGGEFQTLPLSKHTQTNIEVLQNFLPNAIEVQTHSNETATLKVAKPQN